MKTFERTLKKKKTRVMKRLDDVLKLQTQLWGRQSTQLLQGKLCSCLTPKGREGQIGLDSKLLVGWCHMVSSQTMRGLGKGYFPSYECPRWTQTSGSFGFPQREQSQGLESSVLRC